MSARRLRRCCIARCRGGLWRSRRRWRGRLLRRMLRLAHVSKTGRHGAPQSGKMLMAFRVSCRRGGRGAVVAIAALLPLMVGGCRRVHFPKYPSNYREYAWITNGGSDSVTVLDLVNMQQAATIGVGANPTAVAVNAKRDEVYVTNAGSGTVSVIDAKTNRVTATIGVHREPQWVDVDAERARAYVANAGSNNVSVIDLTKRREVGAIGVGEGPAVARIAPDGRSLVVANRTSGSVSVVDVHDWKVRAAFGDCSLASDTVI